jgi:hypothetical protein
MADGAELAVSTKQPSKRLADNNAFATRMMALLSDLAFEESLAGVSNSRLCMTPRICSL